MTAYMMNPEPVKQLLSNLYLIHTPAFITLTIIKNLQQPCFFPQNQTHLERETLQKYTRPYHTSSDVWHKGAKRAPRSRIYHDVQRRGAKNTKRSRVSNLNPSSTVTFLTFRM